MNIRLRPEIEELIKQNIQCGAYKSVDEFVEHAVTILHEQEAWLAANREEIGAKIADGYASAQRGELIDAADVRAHM
jgi:putative addiction module CopG family antidote